MDPTRLANEGDASERALLDSLRSDAPSEEARAGMWKSIAAQAAVATVASSASAATAKVGLAWATKLVVVVAVSAVGAGAALMRSEPPKQPAAVHVARAVVEPAPLSTPDEAPRPTEPDPAPSLGSGDTCTDVAPGSLQNCGPTGELPVEPKRVKRRAPKPVLEAPRVQRLDALQAESQLLGQARSRLRAGDLAGAERALNAARDQFEHGSLGQEREVLQIELLSALGDRDGAEHRARRFLRKHADSPHAKSVQRFLNAP